MIPFTAVQKIKMGLGGLFLALIPAAVFTAVLFTFFVNSYVWLLFIALLGFGFYCGILMLTSSKLPRHYFLSLVAVDIITLLWMWIV